VNNHSSPPAFTIPDDLQERIKVMGKRKRKGRWEWFLKEEMEMEEFLRFWGLSFLSYIFSPEGRELKRKIKEYFNRKSHN